MIATLRNPFAIGCHWADSFMPWIIIFWFVSLRACYAVSSLLIVNHKPRPSLIRISLSVVPKHHNTLLSYEACVNLCFLFQISFVC